MTAYAVWLDTEHAKIFKFLEGKVDTSEIKNHHQVHRDDKHPSDNFYGDLAKHLTAASELLLTGPGIAKEQFQHYLKQHHQTAIASKIVGCLSMDHPTDGEMKAKAREFFKTAHLFS